MRILEESVVLPQPTEAVIQEFEKYWELVLPQDYKEFIKRYNGAKPENAAFLCNNCERMITRFLCILSNPNDNEYGWYDIDVIESQIGERLTANEDLMGVEVLPIAELFAGDYVCLDFREGKEKPTVCVWSHEESGEFDPVTYEVANSFTEFLTLLS